MAPWTIEISDNTHVHIFESDDREALLKEVRLFLRDAQNYDNEFLRDADIEDGD